MGPNFYLINIIKNIVIVIIAIWIAVVTSDPYIRVLMITLASVFSFTGYFLWYKGYKWQDMRHGFGTFYYQDGGMYEG